MKCRFCKSLRHELAEFRNSVFNILENCQIISQSSFRNSYIASIKYVCFCLSILPPTLSIVRTSDCNFPSQCHGPDLYSLMTNDIELFFRCVFSNFMFPLEKFLFTSSMNICCALASLLLNYFLDKCYSFIT